MIDLDHFHAVDTGLYSALADQERSADYDSISAGYDLIVGNRFYNHLVWGCPKEQYRRNAKRWLDRSDKGSLIDFGCGSLVFTATVYRDHDTRLLLFDRSLQMLKRGKRRLPNGLFLQGDVFSPPFATGTFSGASGWGMLHLFGTSSAYLDHLADQVAIGSPVALSTLVLGARPLGDRMLGMLHRKGEAALPETAQAVTAAFARRFEIVGEELHGNMLFLHGTRRV